MNTFWKSLSVRNKIILPILCISIMSGVATFELTYVIYKNAGMRSMVEKARTMVLAAESAREYTADQMNHDVFKGDLTSVDDVLRTIPIFSAMEVARKKATELGYSMKTPKFSPRNPDNEPDAIEAEVLNSLEHNVQQPELWKVDEQNNTIRYFKAIKLTQECMRCHGDPTQSLALWGRADGRDITGAKMENWKVGEVHGAFEISMKLDALQADVRSNATILAFIVVVSSGLIIVISFFVARTVSRYIGQLKDASVAVAGGDTNVQVHVPVTDEIGILTSSFNVMVKNIHHAIQTAQDHAESRLRESDKLRASEEQYRSLVQQSKDTIVIIGISGEIKFISPASKEMFGYTPEEYYADPQLTVKTLSPESLEIFRQFWDDYQLHGKFPEKVMEFVWIHKQGYKVHAEHSFVNVYDQQGDVTGFQSVARDVTQQRVTEVQIMRMQRMDSIGMLAGGIAHDMNNILTPLITGLQILEQKVVEKKVGEKDVRRIKSMQDIVWRGANLVKQILLFSKGSNQERLLLQPMPLVKEIVQLLRETFPKNIRLIVRNDEHIPEVFIDPNQIHQVLMNLLINARDAMPDGGELTLSLNRVIFTEEPVGLFVDAQEGEYLHIAVTDTGMGMSNETKEKMFEPFFTTKSEHKGTGLGLTTVYGIVKNHDGFINVSSELGKGTVFSVYLPIQEQADRKVQREMVLPSVLRATIRTQFLTGELESL